MGADIRTIQTDAVVIGAGLSGLGAAHHLVASGLDVHVVEAKDRVGGRVHRREILPGKWLDLGGRFLGRTQDDIRALAKMVGVETAPFHETGRSVWLFGGERWESEDFGLLRTPAEQHEYDAVRARLLELSSRVDTSAPWAGDDAGELDRQSFGSWLDQNVQQPMVRWAIHFDLNSFFFVPAHRLSLLHVLQVLASTGGWDELDESDHERFVGGSAAIAHGLAEGLGDRVHLAAPVSTIQWGADAVTVHAANLQIHARRCIVSMNPSDARTIRFDPVLPWARGLWHRAHQTQGGVMGILLYDSPFWREDGFSGHVTSDRLAGTYVRDGSLHDSSLGALNSFMTPLSDGPWGAALGQLDTPAQRKAAMLAVASEAFGDRAGQPVDYVEQDWLNEPWTAGVQAALPPGLISDVGEASHRPLGALHWNSTELGERWTGWMNGAAASAGRVAMEVSSSI